MADRYEASVVREKDGKSYWTKLGVMFPSKNGDAFTLYLDALPMPGPDGQAKIILSPPKPKDNQQQGRSGSYRGPGGDDVIPFSPEWR